MDLYFLLLEVMEHLKETGAFAITIFILIIIATICTVISWFLTRFYYKKFKYLSLSKEADELKKELNMANEEITILKKEIKDGKIDRIAKSKRDDSAISGIIEIFSDSENYEDKKEGG